MRPVDTLDRILHGAIDMHCHSGPSPMPRRITHVEAAQAADAAGFRAIVAKCHYHSTVFDILAAQPLLAGLRTQVFGGVALNSQVGGINPHVVDLNLKMGGRVIWFPTISSAAHLRYAAQNETVRAHFQPKGTMQSEEVDIFGPDGDLKPEVHTIIGMAKASRAVISAGHMAPDRITALLEAGKRAGHRQFVVSHPNFIIEAEREQVANYADLGATIEHELVFYDHERTFPLQTLVDWVAFIGPERTSLASDLGREGRALPVEAYRRVIPLLLDSGISENDIRQMIAVNPARLLGLED